MEQGVSPGALRHGTAWRRNACRRGRRSSILLPGVCLQKLGQADKAKAMFQGLVDSGQRALTRPAPAEGGRGGRGQPQSARLRSANAHYEMGLGYLGLGDAAKAKAELAQAVETSPDLLGARTALAALKKGTDAF